MALTAFQRRVCRLIAENRIASGESYVAGGVALNELIGASRVSRDIDLFHDTDEAVAISWDADRRLLESSGFHVRVARERPSYVEADVTRDAETLRMEWVRDSAFRFFPLVQHEEFGLTLHPFDLATNKVLALVGRLEVRDWVDVIHCAEQVQPLGYLAWAASGKDPGFGPRAIIEHAARSSHYSAIEVGELTFEGAVADAADLSRRWREHLDEGQRVTAILPADRIGTCVLTREESLFRGDVEQARQAMSDDLLRFHSGSIKGALPRIVI